MMDLEKLFSVDGNNSNGGLEHQGQEEAVAAARAEMLDPRELERALRRQNAQRMVECEDHCKLFSLCSFSFSFCFCLCFVLGRCRYVSNPSSCFGLFVVWCILLLVVFVYLYSASNTLCLVCSLCYWNCVTSCVVFLCDTLSQLLFSGSLQDITI